MTKADDAQSADVAEETPAVAGDEETETEVGKAESEAEQEQVVVEMEENKVRIFDRINSGLAHALSVYLLPLSGTQCLAVFVFVNL